jgi:RimJ/RimL family protein N-acetyltransferase
VPKLETDRLILRKMQTEDTDDLLAIFGDPRVMAAFDYWVYVLDNPTAIHTDRAP